MQLCVCRQQMRSHFHGILFPHVARWSSGASITATTSSKDKQTESLYSSINFLAHRWRREAWRVCENAHLWTVTALFLYVCKSGYWSEERLWSNLPLLDARGHWWKHNTPQRSAQLVRSACSFPSLFKWVIWGVKSNLPWKSNCFNLISFDIIHNRPTATKRLPRRNSGSAPRGQL